MLRAMVSACFSHIDDDAVTLYEQSELYSLDKLTPDRPFIAVWMPQGIVPHRGISFVDKNGTARYFAIAESGYDGSLFLIEFPNTP